MNTKESKRLLEQALRSLPYNNSLSKVRTHIQKALYEIDENQKTHKVVPHKKPMDPYKIPDPLAEIMAKIDPRQALKLLDSLMDEEQAKIDELTKPEDQTLID